MANDEFREDHESRRQFGKAKQHEKRLENATYTAAEVKALTETASKVAYELGRKDAGEEIAAEFEYLGVILGSYVAERVRAMSSQPSGAVSDERSGGGA